MNLALFLSAYSYNNIAGIEDRIDSLRQQSQQNRQLIAAYYLELLSLYVQENRLQDALNKGNEALNLSRVWGDQKYQFHFLHTLGNIYAHSLSDYPSALQYVLQADQVSRDQLEVNSLAQNYSLMSEVYIHLGDINEALKAQLRAIDLAFSTQDQTILSHGHYSLGKIYTAQGDYEKALESFRTALQYAKADLSTQPSFLHLLLGAIAETYLDLAEADKAAQFIENAFQLADSLHYDYGLAYDEGYWGRYYWLNEEYDKAYLHLRRANEFFKENQLLKEQSSHSIMLARVFNRTKSYTKALAILDTIETVARSLDDVEMRMGVLEARAKSLESLGRKDLAYDYLLHYINLQDSILSDPARLEFSRTESGFAVDKMEQEVAEIRKEQQLVRRQMIIGGMIAGFIVLLVLLLMGHHRNRALNQVNHVLAQKNEEIFLQNERLASSNEELRQFAHVTSHDLREPLRSIGGFATLLDRRFAGKLDDQSKEYLSFITSGVRRMDKLLADLLNYSVIGILEQKFEKVSIDEVISSIIEKFHRDKRTLGVKISIHNLPTLTADSRQMYMLFENLIDNAIKFRAQKQPIISINCIEQNGKYLFSIKDNGIGMDKAYQEQIFSLFLRLHKNNSNYEGTGVGLSICRKIIQQHKGKIWVESQKRKGSTVFFELPQSPLEEVKSINWRSEN